MDTLFRVRVVADEDHNPADLDWSPEEIAEHVRRFEAGELFAVGAVTEHRCVACGTWHHAESLWAIEIDTTEPIGPGDVLTSAEIPLGPADPLRLYGFGDRASIPPIIAVPFTASDSYVTQIAADLLVDATADHRQPFAFPGRCAELAQSGRRSRADETEKP
jgi:hypothetical protein